MASDPQTYADLQASLLAWIDDTASNIDPTECIALAERRLNRLLNVPEMESITTLSASSSVVSLPSDFWEVRDIYVDASPRVNLEPMSISAITTAYASNYSGIPQNYATQGVSLILGPAPDTAYSLVLTYKSTIPALSESNTTNWLLTKHPDLYIAASLAMAEFRGWNDKRLPMLKAWYDELLQEVNAAGQRARSGAGPVRMRPTVRERF